MKSGISKCIIETNEQTGTSYILAESDWGKIIPIDNTSANTVLIPLNSDVPLPIGYITCIQMAGTGVTTVGDVTGVTINKISKGKCPMTQQQAITLIKIGTDVWRAVGGIFV